MTTSKKKHDHQQAVVVVSPASDGDEIKNQDRALWYATQNVACVCDGVTQSPFSERAAELVCQWCPSLFRGDMDQRMGAISDLLITQRLELQQQSRRKLKPAMSLVEQVTQERLAQAFQTTLTAACLTPLSDEEVSAEIVQCGDSALFAFSPEGEVLFETLNRQEGACKLNGFSFAPGDELLVKMVCSATDRMELASAVGIESRHAANWLLCAPLDRPQSKRKAPSAKPGLDLTGSSLLLVPRYLLGRAFDNQYPLYSWLRYSNNIRLAEPAVAPSRPVRMKSSATAALPDHFYQGNWSHYQEQFPVNTSFLLASDGFYTAFKDPTEMHQWLLDNIPKTSNSLETSMSAVHDRLQEGPGDDDVSFVWLTPSLERQEPCMVPWKNGC